MEPLAPRIAVQFEIEGLELKLENWWRQVRHPYWLVKKQKEGEKRAVGLHCLAARASIAGPGATPRPTSWRRSPSPNSRIDIKSDKAAKKDAKDKKNGEDKSAPEAGA